MNYNTLRQKKFYQNIIKNINSNISLLIKDKEIASINNYERDYFISFDKKFRITIDYNINFINMKFNKVVNNELKNVTLIEIKCEEQYFNQMEMITKELPFKISRFSKYTEGIESNMYNTYQ